jgi:hypothetical protein
MGNLKLFNSLGAGLSLNWGSMKETKETNSENDPISTEFANGFGLQVGVLFSADQNTDTTSNTFAPMIAVSFLDFQIGWGYELATRDTDATGQFVTIAYGIPLQKLTRKGTWVVKERTRKSGSTSRIL